MDIIKYHIIPYIELFDIWNLCLTDKEHYEVWSDPILNEKKREWKIKKSLEIDTNKLDYESPFYQTVLSHCGYDKVGNIYQWNLSFAPDILDDYYSYSYNGLPMEDIDRHDLYEASTPLEADLVKELLKNKFIEFFYLNPCEPTFCVNSQTLLRFYNGPDNLKKRIRCKNWIIMCILREWF